MGLTITATFERQGIYFAGETLECHIRFSNERSTQTQALSSAAASASAEGNVGSGSVGGGMAAAAAAAASPPPAATATIAATLAREGRRRSTAQQAARRHRGTVGLAAFPSLDEGSGDSGSAQRAARASSAVSTPTSSFSSWLPFGGRPQQQAQLGLQTARRPTHSTASEAGSSGLLGSLWRNLSGGGGGGGGMLAEGDVGVERLAIGLAEAAGTMALSPAYIGREALEQLVRHRGTDFGPGGARAAPVGGGLGGWVPGAGGQATGGGRAHKTLPLLAAAPAVLFSELALAPGDSQTFSLRIDLPAGLAPSFRGRAACIAYDVVVVAKRSMLDAGAHVARIPFRVLAAVPPGGATPAFALERPLRMPPGSVRLATQEGVGVGFGLGSGGDGLSSAESLPLGRHSAGSDGAGDGSDGAGDDSDGARDDSDGAGDDSDEAAPADALYRRLARSPFLQALLRDTGLDTPASAQNASTTTSATTGASVPALELGGGAGGGSSQANILAACRRRAPVAFSLSQGAQTPASVWLPRRTYQLGDMVCGRIDIHGGGSGAPRVYHISLWLEAREAVGRRFANYGAAQTEELTRRVVAEHHGFCRANRSLGFSLPTPPAAAPSFDSPLVANVWQLRIELITGAAAAHAAPDLALSAATPFPPAPPPPPSSLASVLPPSIVTAHLGRRRSTSTSTSTGSGSSREHVPAADGEAASVLSLSPPPLSPVLSPPPITPLFGSPASAPPRAGRMRSSTVVGNAAATTAAAAAAAPPLPSPAAGRHSLDSQRLPAAARASADHGPRTIRRRYDVAAEVLTQTLSCTVPIQMHPSLASAVRDANKDSYTIDLTSSP
ncbi:Golgi membrane exchange factor (Ric1p-Rgp1p) subunit [Coemansia erecta]|uniref:Golgi membrane exchange factor (Ric1p-Rgp1p) subunit n=1 Tax=Coemansia erecta TaxID=147472 RepID=A0A9W8CVD9_9FUNG|nr:Golgi membrane exchange factor (Ric1p-Rgp1p) subunit [Coemansia erecta]